jgi:hypothetical protein
MRDLFIHIGLHKTATSFLQHEVFPKLKGINYVPQQKFYTPILRQICLTDPLYFNEKEIKNQLFNYLTTGKNLISSEGLSGSPFLQYTNRSAILTKLHNMFPEAKIIIGIRAQKDIIISLYKQYVKHGGVKKFNDFITPYKDVSVPISITYDLLDLETFKYSKYLEKIEYYFGKDNMYIYIYENLKKNPEEFLQGILEFMKVSAISKINYKPVNASWDDAAISIAVVLNRFIKSHYNKYGLLPRPRRPIKFRDIVNVLGRLSIKHTRIISDNMTKFLKDYYRNDNLYIDKKYNLFLEKDHYDEYF